MQESRKAARLRLGLWILTALLGLTLLELWLAFSVPNPLVYLLVINVIDAALIMEYFMHLSHMWRVEE